jgi:hypothetical protein
MLTHAIFIRPDGELIRESAWACANLLNCLLIEEHVLKSNRGSKKTLTIRRLHENDTKRWIQQALCKNYKKYVIPTYSIFQHIYGEDNLVSFNGRIIFWQQNCIAVFFIYSFFQEKMLGDISFKLETKIINFTSVFF